LRRLALALVLILTWAPAAQARVTRITILKKVSPAFAGASFGSAGQYETIAGLADGELEPGDPLDGIIHDLELAPRKANGKVAYTATFFIVKPIDMTNASHLLWHDVPNRGGRITIVDIEKGLGDIGLSSGWQGDDAGGTSQARTDNDWVRVPVAVNPDGSPVTGLVLGRIVNRSGPASQPLLVQANPMPYKPATLDTSLATLTIHAHETMNGVVTEASAVPSTDWAWARCTDWAHQTADPTQICLKDGFDPNLLYQVVFTARDPYVLGVGFAAFRDVGSFFRYEAHDDAGTPNPLAGEIKHHLGGISQGPELRLHRRHGAVRDDEDGAARDGRPAPLP
jgi:hypothetical protein